MDTRVSLQSIVQGALADTGRLTAQLAQLQTQAATGKRYANVSEAPATMLAVLNHETQARTLGAHLDNISTASSRLNASVSTLQDVGNLLSQARSIALDASSSVNDTAAFEVMAQSIDALIDRLLSLANTQRQDGSYIFGGVAKQSAPFVVIATDMQGRPLAVQYQGASTPSSMFVDRAQAVPLDYAGSQIFQARARQAAIFTGSTGARAGDGTDTATARATLTIQHTTTTFAPGSGVLAGASSALGDTILGPAGRHQLRITDSSGNGSAGTVSLDGGPPIAFTSADTNLAVTNANGGVVYLDMSAITPNFNADIDITSAGTLSIDGGVTTIPLTYDPNQSVTDANGKVTFVDTTNVDRTGVEQVNHPGTYDAFQALIALRDNLRNVRQLSTTDQIKAIGGDLAEVDRAHASVLTTVGSQSATLDSLQSLQSHLQDLQLNARKTASELGDADLSELVIKLQSHQTMLQLSFASFSRIVDQNLLDFLR